MLKPKVDKVTNDINNAAGVKTDEVRIQYYAVVSRVEGRYNGIVYDIHPDRSGATQCESYMKLLKN